MPPRDLQSQPAYKCWVHHSNNRRWPGWHPLLGAAVSVYVSASQNLLWDSRVQCNAFRPQLQMSIAVLSSWRAQRRRQVHVTSARLAGALPSHRLPFTFCYFTLDTLSKPWVRVPEPNALGRPRLRGFALEPACGQPQRARRAVGIRLGLPPPGRRRRWRPASCGRRAGCGPGGGRVCGCSQNPVASDQRPRRHRPRGHQHPDRSLAAGHPRERERCRRRHAAAGAGWSPTALLPAPQIPTLCTHPRLPTTPGTCRLCLVEVAGAGLKPACATPVWAGMCVATDSPPVRDSVRGVLALLKANHPADCMVRSGGLPLLGSSGPPEGGGSLA